MTYRRGIISSQWNMLDMGEDIRDKPIEFELLIQNWVGMVYVPLLHYEDALLTDRKSYMMAIYPDDKLFFDNYITEKRFSGKYFYRGKSNPLSDQTQTHYKIKFNIENIFKNMNGYMLNDIKDGIVCLGYVQSSNYKEHYGQIKDTGKHLQLSFSNSGPSYNLCEHAPEPSFEDYKTFLNKIYNVIGWSINVIPK